MCGHFGSSHTIVAFKQVTAPLHVRLVSAPLLTMPQKSSPAKAKEGSSSSVMTIADVPQNLKTALRSLQLATQDVVGTDGHRRLLRHEGVAYSLAFGSPLVFTTPSLADGARNR